VDSFSQRPAIGRSEGGNLTSESASLTDGIDLALLRFVRCLVRCGATIEEAGAVVRAELERHRRAAKPQRRTLVGMRLVPVTDGGANVR
jgi:hypothetical protein